VIAIECTGRGEEVNAAPLPGGALQFRRSYLFVFD
jgi:hypothetical protein